MFFKKLAQRPASFFEEWLISSWWAVLFSLLCLFLYEKGQKQNAVYYEEFKTRLHELNIQKTAALSLKKELIFNIESQADPLFIEQTLMKVLGVVPEGQVKIFFQKKREL